MIDIIEAVPALPEWTAAVGAAARTALDMLQKQGEISVLLAGEDAIKKMNREFRGIDSVTDVLSFPAREGKSMAGDHAFLGDVAICVERARMQANELGHTLLHELSFLTVHGTLHLLGYDHMCAEDEYRMLDAQRRIMAALPD